MKLLIASDIHGDAEALKKLLSAYENEGCDRLLLLGDILYHGPRNDLPSGYAPKEVIRILNENKDKLFAVRGNCEAEVDSMVLDFNVASDYMTIFDGSRVICASHGHRAIPLLSKGDILLCGHTHVPVFEHRTAENGAVYFHINPGSISLPKENSPRSYVIIDGNRVTFHALDGEIYREETIR